MTLSTMRLTKRTIPKFAPGVPEAGLAARADPARHRS
jgi:hypothetical protein